MFLTTPFSIPVFSITFSININLELFDKFHISSLIFIYTDTSRKLYSRVKILRFYSGVKIN